MQGRAQYTGGRTPDDRGDAARSRTGRLPVSRAAGRGRPALDTLHAHAADEKDLPLADRRSQKGRLLLLRRYLCAGAAVLRASLRDRVCAGATEGNLDSQDIEQAEHLVEQGTLVAIGPYQTFMDAHGERH
jgi:hypothetical protein